MLTQTREIKNRKSNFEFSYINFEMFLWNINLKTQPKFLKSRIHDKVHF